MFFPKSVIFAASMGFSCLAANSPSLAANPMPTPSKSAIFRMAVTGLPNKLDPLNIGSTEATVFSNLFRGLYVYRIDKGLIPAGARRCDWSPFPDKYVCQLNPQHRWSDGSQVLGDDYVRAMQRLIDPKNGSSEAAQLVAIKNARAILSGQLPPKALGIRSIRPDNLEFEFETPDVDFPLRLSSAALVPYRKIVEVDRPETWLFNGPFALVEVRSPQLWKLKSQKSYPGRKGSDLEVELRVVEDGTAALNLYTANLIDFVPAIPTSQIPAWRKDPGYLEVAIPRFDYIGFGPRLTELPWLRRALMQGSDFQGLQRLFGSRSRPGCPSFPKTWTGGSVCLKDDVKEAKKQIRDKELPRDLSYFFTLISTDDLKRGAEFYQGAWKRNLGLEVSLQARELGILRRLLQENPPPLFRRGVSLDRPTCLAALELFESVSTDNLIQFKDKKYDEIVQELRRTRQVQRQKQLCRLGLERLYESAALIPQGEFSIGRLRRPHFKGIAFSALGSVDLTNLESTAKRVSN